MSGEIARSSLEGGTAVGCVVGVQHGGPVRQDGQWHPLTRWTGHRRRLVSRWPGTARQLGASGRGADGGCRRVAKPVRVHFMKRKSQSAHPANSGAAPCKFWCVVVSSYRGNLPLRNRKFLIWTKGRGEVSPSEPPFLRNARQFEALAHYQNARF